MQIRKACPEDCRTLSALAGALWPGHTDGELEKEFAPLLERGGGACFLACREGEAVGFAQCQLRRDYVEGTSTSPVGYLEGIYVAPGCRGQGIARALLEACEAWARTQGCREFASDCELDNAGSLQFHLQMGFTEANRIICFTKPLD